MSRLHTIESEDFILHPARMLYNGDSFVLYDDDETFHCRRSRLNKLISRHSPRYIVFSGDERVGKIHGMYKHDKRDGKYGSVFYLELYGKCYAAYTSPADDDAREIVISLQRYPYSISSSKRFPLTPKEIPFARAYLPADGDNVAYTVEEVQHVELHQFANTYSSVICMLLSYMDLHGRDDRCEFRSSDEYRKSLEDDRYYWRRIDEMFV